jgi:hypothetical protein
MLDAVLPVALIFMKRRFDEHGQILFLLTTGMVKVAVKNKLSDNYKH